MTDRRKVLFFVEGFTDIRFVVGLSEKSPGLPKAYEPLLAFLPAFAYNPSVGFLFGAVGIFGIVLGDPDTTTISNVQAIALYTTKSQFISSITATESEPAMLA